MKPREHYNLITDTVGGANIRVRDNVIQAVFILASIVLGVAIGYFGFGSSAEEPAIAAMIGGIIGMVAGLFVSGIALMIYRAVRHAQGKHD